MDLDINGWIFMKWFFSITYIKSPLFQYYHLKQLVKYFLFRPNWLDHCRIDSLLVLPASFGSQDASKILSNCQSVQVALKVIFQPIHYFLMIFFICWHVLFTSLFDVFQSNKAILLGESYVFSAGFVKVHPLTY